MRDPYEVLGVTKDASSDDIKNAYRKLAMKWHPDRHLDDIENAEEKFKEINAANQILSDPDKRAQFDMISEGGGFGKGRFVDLSDMFEHFFTGNRTTAGSEFGFGFSDFTRVRRTGAPHKAVFSITLEEAYSGTVKKVKYCKKNQCHVCGGIGALSTVEICQTCSGSGQSTVGTTGTVMIKTTCRSCRGCGRKLGSACTECSGRGSIMTEQEVVIKVPPGTANGDVLNIGGMYVEIRYAKHPRFRIDPRTLDIWSLEEIGVFDAMIGTSIDVSTLSGNKRMKIPAGIQPGSRLRVRGAGMRDRHGRHGHHIVEVSVRIPKISKLEKDQIETVKKLINPTQDISGEGENIQGA